MSGESINERWPHSKPEPRGFFSTRVANFRRNLNADPPGLAGVLALVIAIVLFFAGVFAIGAAMLGVGSGVVWLFQHAPLPAAIAAAAVLLIAIVKKATS